MPLDQPGMSLNPSTAMFKPDPLNTGWRDYGPRVGIWRLMDLFDRSGIRASCLLNSDACTYYPEIVEEGKKRNWAWIAHGKNNSVRLGTMTREDERVYLTEMTQVITEATGQQPKGWLGPALTESFNTPSLLQELGYSYLLDWGCDDQPFSLNVLQGRLLSVPYSLEINDSAIYVSKTLPGKEYAQMLIDQFKVLYAEGADTARVMGLGLHPFISGQPFRIRYLQEVLAYISQQKDVWLTTSDEIATWYLNVEAEA
ncbi:polysaccharide deacetylase [Dictyobacter alpinus]|uniref:Polysaccharide deacetylase n=2 Tax=Dictyobacter alpinus TaxID=2014873 RepID=A0A402B9V4_9CHLR|nr:polysaccharide deacetylase [Dictyobacter alpinus]